jgi:hypothetical protein
MSDAAGELLLPGSGAAAGHERPCRMTDFARLIVRPVRQRRASRSSWPANDVLVLKARMRGGTAVPYSPTTGIGLAVPPRR